MPWRKTYILCGLVLIFRTLWRQIKPILFHAFSLTMIWTRNRLLNKTLIWRPLCSGPPWANTSQDIWILVTNLLPVNWRTTLNGSRMSRRKGTAKSRCFERQPSSCCWYLQWVLALPADLADPGQQPRGGGGGCGGQLRVRRLPAQDAALREGLGGAVGPSLQRVVLLPPPDRSDIELGS